MNKDERWPIDANSKNGKKECLSVAIDNRKMEIELLWRRTTIFWGFISALFIAVAAAARESLQFSFVLSTVGLVFSVIWTLANRGSKGWQESWEIKAAYYFNELYEGEDTEDVYERICDNQRTKSIFFVLRSRPYSVSRLLIALSDFSWFFWLCLCLYLFPLDFCSKLPLINLKEHAGVLFFCCGVAYCIYVLLACRSKSEPKDISERFKSTPKI